MQKIQERFGGKKILGNNKKIVAGFFLLLVAYLLFKFMNIRYSIFENLSVDSIVSFISSQHIFAPLIFMLIMAIAIIISPIPSLPLSVASGIIWGPYLGTFYAVIGAEVGAIVAFYISRFLGKNFFTRFFHKDNILFCDKCDDRYLGWLVFITRLLPIFQFDIISYGAGLTNIRLSVFAAATFFGMIPVTFAFNYFGKILLVENVVSVIISLIILLGVFTVPVAIRKYNLFGLRGKMHRHQR